LQGPADRADIADKTSLLEKVDPLPVLADELSRAKVRVERLGTKLGIPVVISWETGNGPTFLAADL